MLAKFALAAALSLSASAALAVEMPVSGKYCDAGRWIDRTGYAQDQVYCEPISVKGPIVRMKCGDISTNPIKITGSIKMTVVEDRAAKTVTLTDEDGISSVLTRCQ